MSSSTCSPWSGELPADWRPEAVYLIRYATRPTALRGEHFYGFDPCSSGSMPIDYFVWLVAGKDAAVLIDAGFNEEVAKARPGRVHLGSPLEVAEALGYPKERITDVVLTHLHYDHTGYAAELPHARLHVQERELAFWVGRHAHRELYNHIVEIDDILCLVAQNHAGRVTQSDGEDRIAMGLTAHLVGGHTPGMQVVRAELADGQVVVLASDASHFWENINSERPFSIAHTVPDMFDAFDEVRRLAYSADGRAGIIVPGHDPRVTEDLAPELVNDIWFEGRVWRIA